MRTRFILLSSVFALFVVSLLVVSVFPAQRNIGQALSVLSESAVASLPEVPQMPLTGGSSARTYVYGNGLVAKSSDGALSYHLQDVLSTNSLVTDGEARLQSRFTAYPYGKSLTKESFAQQKQKYTFTGKEDDGKLMYYGARYMDARIGNFLSTDPIITSNSLYAYAGRNPFRFTDPTGMEEEDVRQSLVMYYMDDNEDYNGAFDRFTEWVSAAEETGYYNVLSGRSDEIGFHDLASQAGENNPIAGIIIAGHGDEEGLVLNEYVTYDGLDEVLGDVNSLNFDASVMFILQSCKGALCGLGSVMEYIPQITVGVSGSEIGSATIRFGENGDISAKFYQGDTQTGFPLGDNRGWAGIYLKSDNKYGMPAGQYRFVGWNGREQRYPGPGDGYVAQFRPAGASQTYAFTKENPLGKIFTNKFKEGLKNNGERMRDVVSHGVTIGDDTVTLVR